MLTLEGGVLLTLGGGGVGPAARARDAELTTSSAERAEASTRDMASTSLVKPPHLWG
jgi:hypothetical protein